MKSPIYTAQKKQCASFRIACSSLAITPLWLMLAAANTSAYAQASDEASNVSSAASSPADWTQFLRDNMQRWNPYETVIGVNNAATLGLKWKNPFGASNGDIESSPAVVNGVVYFGSIDHHVYALNASTGATRWSYTTGAPVYSSPAVTNGVVYIGSGRDVLALNASTGARLWAVTVPNG